MINGVFIITGSGFAGAVNMGVGKPWLGQQPSWLPPMLQGRRLQGR